MLSSADFAVLFVFCCCSNFVFSGHFEKKKRAPGGKKVGDSKFGFNTRDPNVFNLGSNPSLDRFGTRYAFTIRKKEK